MKFIRVYQAGKFEVGGAYELDKPSSNHLIKVLRLKNNYSFNLFNGEGSEFIASLEIMGKRAIAHIKSAVETNAESHLKVHLLQGISKGDRMDFVIQKSIELGVASITPVITEYTVVNLKNDKAHTKLQHWNAIAIAACEQSRRAYLPKINPICYFSDAVNTTTNHTRILLNPLSTTKIQGLNTPTNIQILIGPEGGLSESEITQAKQKNFIDVNFGPRILRTETAALAAITATQILWGDI